MRNGVWTPGQLPSDSSPAPCCLKPGVWAPSPPPPSDPGVQAPSPSSLRPRSSSLCHFLPRTQQSGLPAPPPLDPGVPALSPPSSDLAVWTPSPSSLRPGALAPRCFLPRTQQSGTHVLPSLRPSPGSPPQKGPAGGPEPHLHARVVEGDVVGEEVQVSGSEHHSKQDLALPRNPCGPERRGCREAGGGLHGP